MTDPTHALWVDEAAFALRLADEAAKAPKPPSPLDQLFSWGKK